MSGSRCPASARAPRPVGFWGVDLQALSVDIGRSLADHMRDEGSDPESLMAAVPPLLLSVLEREQVIERMANGALLVRRIAIEQLLHVIRQRLFLARTA